MCPFGLCGRDRSEEILAVGITLPREKHISGLPKSNQKKCNDRTVETLSTVTPLLLVVYCVSSSTNFYTKLHMFAHCKLSNTVATIQRQHLPN
jgi:hypothetical protein